jgi:hypothetical protein
MVEQPSGPAFEVHVDDRELAEDLAHASEAGRAAIGSTVQSIKAAGCPAAWLKQCDIEARDGTRLPGCVKLYIPQPAGQWERCFLVVPWTEVSSCSCSLLVSAIPALRGDRASTR